MFFRSCLGSFFDFSSPWKCFSTVGGYKLKTLKSAAKRVIRLPDKALIRTVAGLNHNTRKKGVEQRRRLKGYRPVDASMRNFMRQANII